MASTEVSQSRGRIDVIDAARGVAMLFVFLSHFIEAFYRHGARPVPLFLATRIATPAFFWISGVTLAVLYARHRDRWPKMRDRLIDRGLFLVFVGHLLFMPAHRFLGDSWRDTLRTVFVTDTIGLCVIVGAILITRVGPRGRLLTGLALLLTAWTLTLTWNPEIPSLAWRLKDFLLGDLRDPWLQYNFPPVPWLGVYLIGSAAGPVFERRHQDGRQKSLALPVTLLGAGLIVTALVWRGACRAIVEIAPAYAAAFAHLGALARKLPPSPAYLLLYLGCALLMFAALLAAKDTRLGAVVNRWVVVFGRYSLAAFLFQFYVYYVLVTLIPHPPGFLIPVYFVATVLLLRVLIAAWAGRDANRLITIGYPAISSGITGRYPTLSRPATLVTDDVDPLVEPPEPLVRGPRAAV